MLSVIHILSQPEFTKVSAADLFADPEVGADHEDAAGAGAGLSGAGALDGRPTGGGQSGSAPRPLLRRRLLLARLLHGAAGRSAEVAGRRDAEVRRVGGVTRPAGGSGGDAGPLDSTGRRSHAERPDQVR